MYATWASHDGGIFGYFSQRIWCNKRTCTAFYKTFDGSRKYTKIKIMFPGDIKIKILNFIIDSIYIFAFHL